MCALVDQFAPPQHQYLVGPAYLREAMGDQQGRAPLQEAADRLLNLVFGGAVNCARRVVQDENARIGQQGARNGDTLPLSAGKSHSALPNQRVITIYEAQDEVVRLGIFRCLLNRRLVRSLSQPVGDILPNGAREEEDILLDSRYLRAQRVQAPLAHIDAVNQDVPFIDIINAIDQLRERALASPRLSHDGDGLSWLRMERDIFQHGHAAIAECDVLEHDVTMHPSIAPAIPRLVLVQFRLLFQDLQDAFRPRDAQLHQAEGPVGDEGRKVQCHHQAHVGYQAADRKLVVRYQVKTMQEGSHNGNR